jgi:hypothetical protein
MKQEPELPPLTDEQLDTLRRFALFEVDLAETRRSLSGAFDFDFESERTRQPEITLERSSSVHFRIPEPGIIITREHISNALERKRFGLISERDLVYWATMLLLNDAYVFDPGDEDLIAEWLNDISFNLDAS